MLNTKNLQARRDNFAFKLSAAKYHLQMINEIFISNKTLIEKGEIDNPKTRPLIYHYYAMVYEIYSGFDMTLHFINAKYKLGFTGAGIKWQRVNKITDNNKFQKALRTKSLQTYLYINSIFEAAWFDALKITREYLIHNGIIELQMEFSQNRVNVINPIIKGEIYHFDCNLWGEEMEKVFNSIYSQETPNL